jgi:hypothetical protein
MMLMLCDMMERVLFNLDEKLEFIFSNFLLCAMHQNMI